MPEFLPFFSLKTSRELDIISNSLHPLDDLRIIMVFNKMFFFFYNNFPGFRGRPRFKQAVLTPLPYGGDSSFRPMSTPDSCVTLSSPEKALEGKICCVCLSSMGNRGKDGDGDKGIHTCVLPCLHEFHKVCINRWFEECRRTCPICRYSMEGSGEISHDQILTEEMLIWFSSFHTSGF